MRPHSFFLGCRCTICRSTVTNLINPSGPIIVQEWLTKKRMDFKKEKTFDDLRSPITGVKLRFDFYIPDLNLVIEYDGKQHFRVGMSGIFTEEKFNQIQLYDEIKNLYCETHNMKLLRIPYTYNTKKKIYKILNKYLKTHVCIWFTH